jgi:hypothetical protein
MSSNPFDYVNSILQTKKNIIVDADTEKEYNAFIINRALSYQVDCVMFSNEMNKRAFLDKKMQFDYFINTIRSKKRPFAKWVKSEKSEDLECIKQVYNFSNAKAREALRLLSKDQLQQLKEMTDHGGLRK